MKRSTIVSIIISLALIVVGGVMILIGASNGGYADALAMTQSSPIKISLPGFNSELKLKETKDFKISFDKGIAVVRWGEIDESFPVDKVKSLDIRIGGADVDINTSGNDTIDVSIDGMKNTQLYLENGILHIISENKARVGDINISIPSSVILDSVDIEAGATDMECDGFICKNFNINLGAGNVQIEKLDVSEKVTAELGAGELSINNASIKNIDIQQGVGEFELSGTVSGNLNCECGMGEAEFNFKDSDKDHNYVLKADMGNISLNGIDYSGLDANKSEDNNSSSTYTITCGMGNIEINFAE